MDELALIEMLEARFRKPSPSVEVGVGDDAAVVSSGGGARWAVTTDALVEGVHFDLGYGDARRIGHKALAVNLSDLAAMGATPRHCLLSLTLRDGIDDELIDGLLDGVEALAREHRVSIIGGNLSSAPCLTVTVTALGELSAPGLTRSGGNPGDRLMVTGHVGSAALGLELLRAGRDDLGPEESALVERQLAPEPRVAAGEVLRSMATAGIDISDGLAQDAGHLARSSRCGVRIDLEKLPLSPAYERLTAGRDDPWTPALAGGEDYELLLAVPPPMVRTAVLTAAGAGCVLQEIGELTLGEGVAIIDSEGRQLEPPAGWRHF